MILTDEDKILIKSLYLKRYTARRLTDELPERSCTKNGVNKLFKKLRDTGTDNRRLGSGRPRSAHCPHWRKRQVSSSEVPAVCHWLRSADCQVKLPRTSLCPQRKQSQWHTAGTSEAEALARFMRAAQFASVSSCAQCGASWNTSDASPYK